ncbi:hypothetical protein ASG80_16905 [Agromyces sp. Soil535]|nr:hypothetical protein ASG80_16905 [Agromyces sp. Soil535]
MVLGGCAPVDSNDGRRLSDWTTNIGIGWDTFVTEVLAPVGNALFAILVAWLSIAVAARLVALLPGVRDIRATRRTGQTLRVVGWTLLAVTPIVTVIVTAAAADSLIVWLAVSTPLAYGAVGTLGPGLATRPRVDAKAIAPDGARNEAWAIDTLVQVRKLNLTHSRIRLEGINASDLGDFITIADRTGSGLASAVAWLFQALFNAAPWLLQVTVLDGRSAIASIRRNGHLLDEVELELDEGDVEDDHHRELLALAADFAVRKVAERYPDVHESRRSRTEPPRTDMLRPASSGSDREVDAPSVE